MNFDTEIGGVGRAFPRTSWSLVRKDRDPEALQRLVAEYWKPVYCHIRRDWGKSNEEAKDLTQEFFASAVLDGTVLKNFSPERGSFRAYLKGALNNFLKDSAKVAQKRGGRAKILPLDSIDVPDQDFDTAWRHIVLAKAAAQIKGVLKSDVYEVFERYDLNPERPSYEALAQVLGVSVDTIKNHLTRARAEFRKAVTAIVSDYVDNQHDLSIELFELYGS